MTSSSQFLLPVYAVYALLSVALTVWLAKMLSKAGTVFLSDVFEDKQEVAKAVNELLGVSFYLFCLGYAALIMRSDSATNAVAAIETLAFKLGVLLITVAIVHLVNMYAFHVIRRRMRRHEYPPESPYRVPKKAPRGAA